MVVIDRVHTAPGSAFPAPGGRLLLVGFLAMNLVLVGMDYGCQKGLEYAGLAIGAYLFGMP